MVYELYLRIYQPNIVLPSDINKQYIFIPTDTDFYEVVKIISENGLLINANSFEWLAKQKKYSTNIKAGRYKIDRTLNNNQLISVVVMIENGGKGSRKAANIAGRLFSYYNKINTENEKNS